MTETDTAVATRRPDSDHPSIAWLEAEFPGWEVSHRGHLRLGPRRAADACGSRGAPGHHPQAELTAAKLHTRLTDYLDREARRRALAS